MHKKLISFLLMISLLSSSVLPSNKANNSSDENDYTKYIACIAVVALIADYVNHTYKNNNTILRDYKLSDICANLPFDTMVQLKSKDQDYLSLWKHRFGITN